MAIALQIPMRSIVTALFAFSPVLISCGLRPAEASPSLENRKITRLSVDYLGEPSEVEERIRKAIASKIGKNYSSARVDETVVSLYESGMIEDVRFADSADGSGVALTAWVTPRRAMGVGPFRGNTAFSDSRLARVSGLKASEMADRKAIESVRRRIEAFYRQHGYKAVKVSTVPAKSGRYFNAASGEEFDFMIEEGVAIGGGLSR